MSIKFLNRSYQKIKSLIQQTKVSRIEKNRNLFYGKFSPQSENDFINACCKNNYKEQKEVALAIRSSIAKLAQVDNDYIRSNLSFSNLELLPIWNLDIFNTTMLVMYIESELSIHFTNEQLESASVRNPNLHPDMKVDEFINEFYCWYISLNLK